MSQTYDCMEWDILHKGVIALYVTISDLVLCHWSYKYVYIHCVSF